MNLLDWMSIPLPGEMIVALGIPQLGLGVPQQRSNMVGSHVLVGFHVGDDYDMKEKVYLSQKRVRSKDAKRRES